MRRNRLLILALIALILGVGGGVAGAHWYQAEHPFGGTSITTLSAQAKIVEASQSGLTIPQLVNQYSPAVVAITTTSTTYSFFGGPVTQEGEGSGMILTSDGYILTNNHVVPQGSQDPTVTLSNQKTYTAQIIANDPTDDLALLKINATGLSTVSLGDSDSEVTGDSVIAIGNALGEFQNTVTNGIISATNRSITASDSANTGVSESLSGLLQTDAAINPGNSGGPLIDSNSGMVIGVNVATSSTGQDLGFSIPINVAKNFISQHISL